MLLEISPHLLWTEILHYSYPFQMRKFIKHILFYDFDVQMHDTFSLLLYISSLFYSGNLFLISFPETRKAINSPQNSSKYTGENVPIQSYSDIYGICITNRISFSMISTFNMKRLLTQKQNLWRSTCCRQFCCSENQSDHLSILIAL